MAGAVCPVAGAMYTVLGKVRSSAGMIDSVAGVVCPVAGVILISVRGLAWVMAIPFGVCLFHYNGISRNKDLTFLMCSWHSIKRTETRQVIMFSTKPLEMWG